MKRCTNLHFPVLLLFFSVLSSCTGESAGNEFGENTGNKLTVGEAKARFEELAAGGGRRSAKSTSLVERRAVFKRALLFQTPDAFYVEVPIWSSHRSIALVKANKLSNIGKQKVLNRSVDRLVVKKDKATGVISEFIVTYTPSLNYLKKHNSDPPSIYASKSAESFEGFVHYRAWDGSPLYVREYARGVIVKTFSFIEVYSKSAIQTGSVQCEEECYPVYENLRTRSAANWQYIGEECYHSCLPAVAKRR